MDCKFEQKKSSLKDEIKDLYKIAKSQNDFYNNNALHGKRHNSYERATWLVHSEYMNRLHGIMDRHDIK